MNNKILDQIIKTALLEDCAQEDITSQLLISSLEKSQANLVFKQDGVICGLAIAYKIFKKLDSRMIFRTDFKDGQYVKKQTIVASITGKTRALLAGERTALNFLMHLSGVATKTYQFTQKVKAYCVDILDTRKTTPGLRYLEKYAVLCGGGVNHRMSLSDMILIKDNHLVYALKKYNFIEIVQIFRRKSNKKIELEVDNLSQFQQALSAKPDIILLDNMSIADMKKAVSLRKKMLLDKEILLEASGGVNINNLVSIAQTGIDRISVGGLTHSPAALDISLDFVQ